MNKEDDVNNLEQITLSTAALKDLFAASQQGTLTITLSRSILQSKYQPFSIVVTGDFEYEKVVVVDQTDLDYENKPQTQRPFELPQWAVLVALIMLIVVILGYVLSVKVI